MVPRIDMAIRKQQEGTMDPITALNQEFARLVQEDWSRQASERPSERATPARLARPVARLRVMLGNRLIAVGMWIKAPARLAGAEQ
jgi:hypothetical protein